MHSRHSRHAKNPELQAFVLEELKTLERLRVQKAQQEIQLELSAMKDAQSRIAFYHRLTQVCIVGIPILIAGLSVLLGFCYGIRLIRQVSTHTAKIGAHSEIPIHHRDLSNFYPIAVNLSLAEIEASVSSTNAKAYQMSRQMIDDITNYTRAIAGRRGLLPSVQQTQQAIVAAPGILDTAPTLHQLLAQNLLAPGSPLILGYHQGQPEHRSFQALKSLAVAGWQGSGKTYSLAYLIAAAMLCESVRAFIIDPHAGHDESLSTLLAPLGNTTQLEFVNPFALPQALTSWNQELDGRLRGDLPSEPGILIVIDELARLAKMEYFGKLVTFIERCTEETRKAHITFIGCSQKWTARHFQGRADIRQCMNSMLIHKTKPSQADLLLEDPTEKRLVKQLEKPGQAILVTDYGDPVLVSMPLCTPSDMAEIATKLPARENATTPQTSITPVMLIQYRTRERLTQAQCGERFGVSQKDISRMETGQKPMPQEIRDLLSMPRSSSV